MTHLNRLTCEETFRRLDDYLDRELSPDEMRMVREHLETCAACAHEYAFEAAVLADLRVKLQRIAAPPALVARLSDLLQEEKARAAMGLPDSTG